MEGDKGKKRMRAELEGKVSETIVGEVVKKDGVTWAVKKGKVCANCWKVDWRCL